MKKIIAVLLLVGLVGVLCSCGHSAKSESDILSDLQEIDDFFQDYNLSVDSSEILKRQTNQNDKTDYVWIEFNASNDDFAYYASYELTYVLYNDGWLLEDWDRDSWSYYGLHPESVEQAAADNVMSQQGYDEFTFNGRYEDRNQVIFDYIAYKEEYYVQTTYDVTVCYNFSPRSLWNEYELSESELSAVPDVLGEWVYDDGHKRYSVNFISVDLENETAELEVRLENYDDGGSEVTLDSEGPMPFDISVASPYRWRIHVGKTYYVGTVFKDYIDVCFDGDEHETIHGVGSGVSIDGYWLIRQDSVDDQTEGSTIPAGESEDGSIPIDDDISSSKQEQNGQSTSLDPDQIAVIIQDTEYSAAQLNYYYSTSYMNFYNSYGNYISFFFDPETSLADQPYDENMSWREYFLDNAAHDMARIQMLNDMAEASGFTLSEEQLKAYDKEAEKLETAWEGLGYSSLQQYLNMNYGEGVDIELAKQELYRTHVASAYSQCIYDSYSYTADELNEYYAEHADDMNMIHYAYLLVSDDAVDIQAIADAIDGGDMQAFSDYLAYNLGSTELTEQYTTGDSISHTYSDWLLDDVRQPGDVAAFANETAEYVVMFLSRDTNDYPPVSFRHILVMAEDADGNGAFSSEEINAAADEAQSVYDEWKNGDATEDSFAELANKRSDDSGSNTNGGLYENVAKGNMVEPINDWIFEDGRQAGDTAVVFYDGANYTGFHVLYFVGQGDMTYASVLADDALRNMDYTAWQEEAMVGYQIKLVHEELCGMNH